MTPICWIWASWFSTRPLPSEQSPARGHTTALWAAPAEVPLDWMWHSHSPFGPDLCHPKEALQRRLRAAGAAVAAGGWAWCWVWAASVTHLFCAGGHSWSRAELKCKGPLRAGFPVCNPSKPKAFCTARPLASPCFAAMKAVPAAAVLPVPESCPHPGRSSIPLPQGQAWATDSLTPPCHPRPSLL